MTDPFTEIARTAGFAPAAFEFVERGLSYTVRRTHGEAGDEEKTDAPHRHVSGAQLCEGLRDYALQQYGLLARTVLRRWGVTRCEDFGRIVFTLIDHDLMQKTDDDTIDDFCDVFDFDEAFGTAAGSPQL